MTSRRRAATALLVVMIIGCGGGGGSAPQPAPSPEPTTAPQPSPTPGTSPTPVPAQGAALQVERVDPDAECDPVVPARVSEPVTLTVDAPGGASCLGGTGDGTGHVAVGFQSGDAATWTIFAADGSRAGSIAERGLTELLRQPQGWHGIVENPLYAPFEAADVIRIGPDGAVGTRSAVTAPAGALVVDVRAAEDPAGGSGVAAALAATGGNHASRTDALRFDASAAPVHGNVQVMADTTPLVSFLGAGVSMGGEMIATYRLPGSFVWTWIARDGRAAAQGSIAQADARADDPVHVAPLLDGSVAMRFAGEWTIVVPRGGTTAAAAPAWLASSRGKALRIARGARAYAVLPAAGEALPDCAQVVELRARSGRLCGRVTIREGSAACTGRRVEQGWDGTLIHESTRAVCSAASCSCAVHAWPRLLAAP